jgi:hypothetical protein
VIGESQWGWEMEAKRERASEEEIGVREREGEVERMAT